MPQEQLFEENYEWNDASMSLSLEVKDFLQETFQKWADLGYSPREIAYILQRSVIDAELLTLSARYSQRAKEEPSPLP